MKDPIVLRRRITPVLLLTKQILFNALNNVNIFYKNKMYIVKIRTGQIYRKLAKFLKFQKMKNPYGARMDDLKK